MDDDRFKSVEAH
jgi:hypothetical protein